MNGGLIDVLGRFFLEFLFEKPDLLSHLRPLYVNYTNNFEIDIWFGFVCSGLDLFNTQLHDYSISYKQYEKKKFRTHIRYLQSFQNTQMSLIDRQSYEVMEYFMNLFITQEHSERFSYHHYLINQMMGAQSEIISFITKFHRILSVSDAEAYLIRVDCLSWKVRCLFASFLQVQRISKAFDQLIEQQIERRRRNIETPRFVLQRVVTELETFEQQLKNEPNQR